MSIFKQECQKTEPSIYQRGKTRSVIYFFIEKRGRIVYLVMLKRGGDELFCTHIRTMSRERSFALILMHNYFVAKKTFFSI